jgi:hypothetical protein
MTNATVGVPLAALLLAACLPVASQAGVRQQVLAAQELRVCVVPITRALVSGTRVRALWSGSTSTYPVSWRRAWA